MINIRARNNLDIPVRLTITSTSVDQEILITIGSSGAKLKDYYNVCIDTDLAPSREWDDIGNLGIENNYRVSVKAEGKENDGN
ncbi:MAG TPA: hypothetical protein VMV76_07600 [Dehalococcoidia bacterium]|nr:hypothetical protein [Dehalococcoidia bacterium]